MRRLPRHAEAVGLALVVFIVHALLAPPRLFWLDAGDFTTASFVLGVPHATGFPTYTLVGKLAMAVPVGSVAFRMALVSSLCAGVASMCVWYTLEAVTGRMGARTGAIAAALALWCTDVGALYAKTADVYALQMALVAGALLLLARLAQSERLHHAALGGFVVGLGMTNHATFRLFAPAFLLAAVVMVWRAGGPRRAVRGAGAWLLGAALGVIPYVYLPLASARAPYHAWGFPDTFERFWAHIWGSDIRHAFGSQLLSFDDVRSGSAVDAYLGQLSGDFGALLLLAAVGAIWLCRRHGVLGLVTILLFVTDSFYSVWINPMGLVDDQNGGTAWVILALWVGISLAAATERLRQANWRARRRVAIAVAAVATVALLAVITVDPARVSMTGIAGPEDLTAAALLNAEPGALVLTDSEELAAGGLYVVGVGALRPDVQVLGRYQVFDGMLLVHRSEGGAYGLAEDDEVARWRQQEGFIDQQVFHERLSAILGHTLGQGRAVYWEGGNASDSAGLWEHLRLGFPLHSLAAMPGDAASPAPADVAAHLVPDGDPWAARWMAGYMTYLGTYRAHFEDWPTARARYEAAHELDPLRAAPMINLGVISAREGDFEAAADWAREALAAAPLNLNARLNLVRYLCMLDDGTTARDELATARRLGAGAERAAEIERFLEQCRVPGSREGR